MIKSNEIKKIIIFFILSLIFILINRDYYLIPFIKNYQESLPSMATYLYSYGNIFREDLFFIIPKYLNCNLEIVKSDSSWTNIYYLLFTPLVKIFGTNYLPGRLFPIILNLIGLYLIIRSQSQKFSIIIFSSFLIFCSSFKDGLAFNFHDSLFLLLIGFFLILKKNNVSQFKIFLFIIISAITIHYSLIFYFFYFLTERLLKDLDTKKFLIHFFYLLFLSILIILLFEYFYNYDLEKILMRINEKFWIFDKSFIFGNIKQDSIIRMVYLFYAEIRDNLGLFIIPLYLYSIIYFIKKNPDILIINISTILFYIFFAKQIIPHNFMMLLFLTIVLLTSVKFIDYFFQNKHLIKNLSFLLIIINMLLTNFYNPTTYQHNTALVNLDNDKIRNISKDELLIDKKKMNHICYFYLEKILKKKDLIN